MSLAATRRHPRLLIAAVVLIAAAAVLLAGRGGDSGSPAVANAAAAKTVKIDIKGMAFSKKTVTVKVGTKITWTNRDSVRHNAYSSKSGGPRGALLAKGESYTWVAKKVGTYNYICTPHPFMKGKIIVKK